MNRLRAAFDGGKAFIPFITCGDPDLETTERLIYAMEGAGADMIELGIPFSDPTAEGPIIQAANIRALSNQVTTDDMFRLVGRVRRTVKIPLVFMAYANVVFSYGTDMFMRRCKEEGVDGMVLPDIPFEEKGDFAGACQEYGIEYVSLIAPASHGRIKMIATEAEGFVYCVSSLGVTETRTEIMTDVGAMAGLVKETKDIPCAVGVGISTPEQAREMAACADGVIAGSAIVKLCARHGRACVPYVERYVKEMKEAIC